MNKEIGCGIGLALVCLGMGGCDYMISKGRALVNQSEINKVTVTNYVVITNYDCISMVPTPYVITNRHE